MTRSVKHYSLVETPAIREQRTPVSTRWNNCRRQQTASPLVGIAVEEASQRGQQEITPIGPGSVVQMSRAKDQRYTWGRKPTCEGILQEVLDESAKQ
jgi:hypothetical protein